MTMKASPACLSIIRRREGLRLHRYKDSGGVETIGFGHRIQPGDRLGDAITNDQAEALLQADVRQAELGVVSLVTVPLTQNQFDALVSLFFNLGAGQLRTSTIVGKLNARRYKEAAGEFGRWIFDNGTPLPGLIERRAEEALLFIKK